MGKYKYEESWMDNPGVVDKFITNPELRVSQRSKKNPNIDKTLPVIICAHGYSASTYEWEEFKEYTEADSQILISNVLLGGHGRSLKEFEESTWLHWGQPIIEEYEALMQLGFKRISLLGASAGAALMLEALLSHRLKGMLPPEQLIMIDPFIIPADKNLTLIPMVGRFIKNFPFNGFTEEEHKHWYYNRPSKTLMELNKLRKEVQRLVKVKRRLDYKTHITVYKTIIDDAASPEGADFLKHNLKEYDNSAPEVHMVDSNKHVFTRGKGRAQWSDKDKQLQLMIFDEIIKKILPA